jgi:predicted Zn-dependent protease
MSDPMADDRRLAAAQHYLEVGQPERALDALSGLDPAVAADAYAMSLRCVAHLRLEDFERAAGAAREGLQDNPTDTHLLSLLSIAEAHRGDLAAAEKAILGALALDAEHPELLAQYADVLMRAGQLDKAERVLGHAAAAGPDSLRVLETRIMLAHLRHDDRRAEQLTEELLARDPGSVSGQQMLGVLEWGRGDATSASQRFAEVVRADPTDHDSADAARATRSLSNPLWWPVRVIARFGAAPTWIAAIAVILGLRAAGLHTASAIAGGVWLVMCVTSWIAAWKFRER